MSQSLEPGPVRLIIPMIKNNVVSSKIIMASCKKGAFSLFLLKDNYQIKHQLSEEKCGD